MIGGRKHAGGQSVSPFVLMLIVFCSFLVTYNLLIPILHSRSSNRKFHVVLTATDAPYSKWQCRIMYYWYKKMKDTPGSDMGGFTRVLHSGRPDDLMDEIPTFVVDPLPHGLDRVRISFT